MLLSSALHCLASVGDDLGVNVEVLLGVEAENLLEASEFLSAQGGSVNLSGVLLLGGGPSDDGLQNDDGRLGSLALSCLNCGVELSDVFDVFAGLLPVDGENLPAIRFVACGDVFGEGDVGVVFDRDLVRVVDGNEVAEFLVSGE